MENGRSCEDFLNMQSHQAISDNKIVNSALPCWVLIFWHWRAHYLSMHLGWCQPAHLPHVMREGSQEASLITPRQVQGSHKPAALEGSGKGGGTTDLVNDKGKLGENWWKMKSMDKEGGTGRNMGIELREEGEKAMIVNAVLCMAQKGKTGCQNTVQEENGRSWCTRTVWSRSPSFPWSRMQSGDTSSCRNVAPATVLVLSLFLAAPNQGRGSGVFAQREPCPRAPHWAG